MVYGLQEGTLLIPGCNLGMALTEVSVVKESIALQSYDVVFISGQGFHLTPGRTARTIEVVMEALTSLRKIKNNSIPVEWITDGIECQVMTPTSNGWVNGKVRLSLEFIPDEEEVVVFEQEAELVDKVETEEKAPPKQISPLDEFRQANVK